MFHELVHFPQPGPLIVYITLPQIKAGDLTVQEASEVFSFWQVKTDLEFSTIASWFHMRSTCPMFSTWGGLWWRYHCRWRTHGGASHSFWNTWALQTGQKLIKINCPFAHFFLISIYLLDYRGTVLSPFCLKRGTNEPITLFNNLWEAIEWNKFTYPFRKTATVYCCHTSIREAEL